MIKYEMIGLILASTPAPIYQDAPEYKTQATEAVREVLLNDPELLQQALNNLAVYQKNKAAREFNVKYGKIQKDVETDEGNFIGDSTSNNIIVVFSDYNCKYCAILARTLESSSRKGYKIIVKELPILGTSSEMVARYAIVAARRGSYEKFYFLTFSSAHSTESDMRKIIEKLGWSYETIHTEVEKPWVTEVISSNKKMAISLGIGATPTLIYQGNRLDNGLLDIPRLLNGKAGAASQ